MAILRPKGQREERRDMTIPQKQSHCEERSDVAIPFDALNLRTKSSRLPVVGGDCHSGWKDAASQ
jgi:hypothetical protein